MIRIRISEDALSDLNQGFLFYEAQLEGLGDYFATSLRSDIESLRLTAGIHRIVYLDFHRLIGKTFPYGVFYTTTNEFADVWAVVDLRRDPSKIREQLDKLG